MADTPTLVKKQGRPRGPRPDLQQFPGILGEQRLAWNRMSAQARYRSELFLLTWEEFQEVWSSHWTQRGREINSLCLTRCDWNLPWTRDNVELVQRLEHVKRQGRSRRGKKYPRRAVDNTK